MNILLVVHVLSSFVDVESYLIHVEHVWSFLVQLKTLDKSDIVDYVDRNSTIDNDCLLEKGNKKQKVGIRIFYSIKLFSFSLLFSEEFDYFITSGSLSFHMSK